MEDFFVLSQTCKKWNEIINKLPNTANMIWYKIARRFYDSHDGWDFKALELMDSGCKHDSNSEWRMLLYIERVANLKIFNGKVGQFLKQLIWVFRSDHIIPYNNMTWTEESVHKTWTEDSEHQTSVHKRVLKV